MQGRHLQNTAAFAKALFGVLEVGDLQHHRQGLDHKDTAHDGQHNFLPNDDGNRAQRSAQCQCAHITHEDLSRVCVEP